MQYLLFGLFIIFGYHSRSQTLSESYIRRITPFSIGDSLNRFKDSIICADADYPNELYNENSKCRAYRYLPIQSDSAKIANVSFGILFLFVNLQNKIKTITYGKNYISTSATLNQNKANEEFNTLKAFLKSLFQIEGLSKIEKDKFNMQKIFQ